MKKLIALSIFFFTLLFSYTVVAQQMRSLRSGNKLDIPNKIQKLVTDPLPAGTYTIGTTGEFPTIDSAFTKLSVDGIAGSVELLLIDTLYTAPTNSNGFFLNGPIPGASQTNRVTISPDVDKFVTIEGNGACILTFLNTSYLTLGYYTSGRSRKPIQNENLGNNTRLVIHANHNSQFKWNDCVHFLNNSDNNIIENVTIINEDYARGSLGIGFGPTDVNNISATDSNIVSKNIIKKAGWGIYFEGPNNQRATGNYILMNSIGSATDSLIGWGIQLYNCKNTLVERNLVQNLKFTANISEDIINVGINSYWGDGDTFRNNIVHNIKSSTGYMSTGILLSGSNNQNGINNIVYNNMVYNIQSTSTQNDSRVSGIQMWNQSNPKVYYNSVYLTGEGSNHFGSAALYIHSACTNVDAKNNIFVNTKDEQPYCASSVYDYSSSNLTSDYNDIYCPQTQNNCLVRIGSNKYNQLTDWQNISKDVYSINEMPNFMGNDLYINETIPTNLESHGTPIEGIIWDINYNARNDNSPDIGAHEFNGTVVGVNNKLTQPVVFKLEQNFPNPFNPTTKIKYSITSSVETHRDASVQLKVYDVLGREVTTLINETKQAGNYEVEFNASTLSSGVYFYQLKAGDFIQTKKMILLK